MRCGQCGYEAPTGAATCPACATPLGGRGGDAPNPFEAPRVASAAPRPVEVGGGSIPWERERSFGALLETIRVMLLDTGPTFDGARRHAPVGPALVYALILSGVAGVAQAFWTVALVLGQAGAPSAGEVLTILITTLVSVPVAILVSTTVVTAMVHVALIVLGGATNGYAATFRTYAYAVGSTAPFALLPGVGSIIQFVWGLVILVQGLHRIHGVSATKALLALVIPFCLLALLLAVNVALLLS